MKRLFVIVLIIGAAVAGAGAGYWFGLRQESNSNMAIDNMFEASYCLDLLKQANIDLYSLAMESKIDQALLANHHLEDTLAFQVLPPRWNAHVESHRREILGQLAAYRRDHASPTRPEAIEAMLAQLPNEQRAKVQVITPDLLQSASESQKVIEEMVTHYAPKSLPSQ